MNKNEKLKRRGKFNVTSLSYAKHTDKSKFNGTSAAAAAIITVQQKPNQNKNNLVEKREKRSKRKKEKLNEGKKTNTHALALA